MDYVKKFLQVEGLMGQGSFGRVLMTKTPTNNRYALKCTHPILRPQRLASELRYLRDLGGLNNVVQMHTAYLSEGSLFIVMDLIEHNRFTDFVAQVELEEIVIYMKNLLIALDHLHTNQIMHRDIKPANFLYDRKNRKFLLVDFGLAQKVRYRGYQLSSAKRPAETNFNQMLKKLRVSNDEVRVSTNDNESRNPTANQAREPVRLTVGAYESPVTSNESSDRIRNTANNHRFSTPKVPRRQIGSTRCDCRGKPKTCTICLSRPDSNAPKSGTPGFKAPEVLLRYPYQTTAIDIWSAGVIFVCLLSGHSPFFRDVDDAISLGEIITIFGSQRMAQAAEALGIRLDVEPKREPFDLKQLCSTIRFNNKKQLDIPDAAFELLNRMLDPNPFTRITASDALKHSWLAPSPTIDQQVSAVLAGEQDKS